MVLLAVGTSEGALESFQQRRCLDLPLIVAKLLDVQDELLHVDVKLFLVFGQMESDEIARNRSGGNFARGNVAAVAKTLFFAASDVDWVTSSAVRFVNNVSHDFGNFKNQLKF